MFDLPRNFRCVEKLDSNKISGDNFNFRSPFFILITSNSPKKSEITSAPINVPGYLRKHWSLVISLREQLETK